MAYFETSGLKIDLEFEGMPGAMAEAFLSGKFERKETALVADLLHQGHRVLEIGTCTGYVAMVAASILGSQNVFSYEANPKAVELARHHFAINRKPIEVTNAVLVPRSKMDGQGKTMRFSIAPVLVSSSLAPSRKRETVDVPVMCLEDQIAARRANFMIVDIEGAEVDLLPEADLSAIDGIIMETHYRKAGEQQTNRMVRALSNKGLSIHLRHSSGEVIYFYRDNKVS